MANKKLKLRLPKDPLEIELTQDQMNEINVVRSQTFNIYNFHRSVMIMLVKEMAGQAWTFGDQDPIKLEFDPNSLSVRISVDEKTESLH